jgi:hypothetical protein
MIQRDAPILGEEFSYALGKNTQPVNDSLQELIAYILVKAIYCGTAKHNWVNPIQYTRDSTSSAQSEDSTSSAQNMGSAVHELL